MDDPKRKPLVTVEFQIEVDIATGDRERRMFVKMYFEAPDPGLEAHQATPDLPIPRRAGHQDDEKPGA